MSKDDGMDFDYPRACNCIGPQNGQPRCPCMMRGLIQRDGRWIEPEHDLGPVVQPSRTELPVFPQITPAQRGCVCPPGSEATCQGPLCPRKPMNLGATS